ncbi:MAG: TolC family outer membrane protein [Gammaproteobacteria bacterium]|nr:TolC family outer membrane protein [Gammaproteobacteria bacterium]MBT5054429.1 TolC family outer membrane protein [Gammaproteobacteria bacterium]MDC0464602.1 TolC family outer membrane protein [Pseudomonadales bacterium]
MRRLNLITPFLLSFSALSSGQTLVEAIEQTLLTNPNIQASAYNVDAAGALRRQAVAGYLPSIDLVLARGLEKSDNTTTRATGDVSRNFNRFERSITLNQMLYDGFSTAAFVNQQNAILAATTQRLATTRENTALRSAQAYLEVLRRDQVVALSQVNLVQHEETLQKIEERFESGVGTKVDVVQTKGRRAQSKSSVLVSEKDAQNGRVEFYRVIGESPRALSLPVRPKGLPETLEQAVQTAFRNSPQVKAAQFDLEASQSARKQILGGYHPRVDLALGATRNDDMDGSPGANDDETAVIKMSYNLYRGGADRAKMKEAIARINAAEQALISLRRSITQDVSILWNDLEDLSVRIEYLQLHVTSTEEVLEVYLEQLSIGKRSLLDVLDIQNELFRARSGLVSAEFQLRLAEYRLLATGGQFLTSMGFTNQ